MSLRVPIALLLAAAVSLGLFYLMHVMISSGHGRLDRTESYSVVDFVRLKRESETQLKKRVIPEKPPLPKEPPPPPQMSVAQTPDPQMPEIRMNMPKISSTGVTGGPFMGVVGGAVSTTENAELIPLVRIAPRYPRKAAMAGTEGWVKLSFTVTKEGSVKDVEVVEAKPRRVFDRAAKQAILKWKFKPKVVDGKPVERQAVQTIDFKLTSD